MIEKHELSADFEKLTYTPDMLHDWWKKFYISYQYLLPGGFTSQEIVDLVKYISESNFSYQLFCGSSLGRLLISKPRQGKLNYQQTLSIEKEWNSNVIKLTYDDRDILNKGDNTSNAILWTTECSGEQLFDKFNEFISWNKSWFSAPPDA
jgi:hypothetical protein